MCCGGCGVLVRRGLVVLGSVGSCGWGWYRVMVVQW